MKSKVSFIILSIVLIGYQSCSQKSARSGELPIIDVSKNYPQKEIHLQSIADIEYVPLETTDKFLLDGRAALFYVSDNYILVWQRQGDIFVFNRNGKAISHFNRLGNGPEEYTRISNVIFDEKNEEVFVNAANSPRILVYSLAGVYKRALTLPDNIRNRTVYNFDDETLLVYDVTGLRADEYKEDPYIFVSKRDGGIVSTLDFRLPTRYATMTAPLYSITGEIRQPPVMFAVPNNIHFGEDFVIADFSSDTIYRLP